MDDTAQSAGDAGNVSVGQRAPQQDQTQQPQANSGGLSPVGSQPQTPPSPVSIPAKEQAPAFSSPTVEAPFMESSEKAPELSSDVEKAGVEVVKPHEVPNLSLEDKKAGLMHAPVIAPVPTQHTDNVVLPMTQQQASQTVRTNKKTSNSIVWLAISILRQLKMMHAKGDK